MERFTGLEIYLLAAVPLSLLLTAVFYLGYKKSCALAPLILTQLFAFISILVVTTLFGVYGIFPDIAMPIIYLVMMLIFYVGGATMTGKLMKAKAWQEKEQDALKKGDN